MQRKWHVAELCMSILRAAATGFEKLRKVEKKEMSYSQVL